MPTGPLPLSINAVAVGVAETVVAVLPVSNWNNLTGNLIEFLGAFAAPATAGSLVLKIRQGTTTAGAQVGQTITITAAISQNVPAVIAAADASAFGQLQAGGQYCVTAQYAAASGGTITGVATLETCSPVN